MELIRESCALEKDESEIKIIKERIPFFIFVVIKFILTSCLEEFNKEMV